MPAYQPNRRQTARRGWLSDLFDWWNADEPRYLGVYKAPIVRATASVSSTTENKPDTPSVSPPTEAVGVTTK